MPHLRIKPPSLKVQNMQSYTGCSSLKHFLSDSTAGMTASRSQALTHSLTGSDHPQRGQQISGLKMLCMWRWWHILPDFLWRGENAIEII